MPRQGAGRIDVEALKSRLLSQAEHFVTSWIPAGKKGGEYIKFGGVDGAAGHSAWVNIRTGAWRDEADPDCAGGDLISLFAALRCGGDNGRALLELAAELGMLPAVRKAAEDAPMAKDVPTPSARPAGATKPEWTPLSPVPADAPDYRTQWGHFARGTPAMHWEYRDGAGRLMHVVCRFEASDGTKDVQPLSYCQGNHGVRAWRYKAALEPRPLYGLDRLHSERAPNAAAREVIVVEGEKCADALHAVLGAPVVSWSGGANAAKKADWSPLKGCRVVCWPDADAKVDKRTGLLLDIERQPGMQAMRAVEQACFALGCEVSIVDIGAPGDRPDGWDCADAIAEGWGRAELLAFMGNVMPSRAAPAPAPAGIHAKPSPSVAAPPEADQAWHGRLIWRGDRPRECVPNVIEVMQHHPVWVGVIAYNEFSDRVVKLRPPPYDKLGISARISDEWGDVDDTRAATWIAQNERFVPSSAMVAEAVNVVARSNAFHPVLQYLQGLKAWDQTARLDFWLSDHLHVADCEYSRLVGRWFLMGMVARVLQPGVKFDYCLVLEGKQGRMKSTALRILAGEWFSDIELDLANKDAMSNIRGKWLHEFGEMGSIARSESQRQKSFLSRQFDEFRPVYGRREIRCPRQLVFAGTTNEWQWNKDPTGGRRFWPLEVPDEINIEGLNSIRDQLFAEAYARVLAGERFWPTGQEQRELFDPEQLAREVPNSFTEILSRWLTDKANAYVEFTLADAIQSGLKIEAKGITRDIETRAGMALHKLGCEKFERRSAAIRHWYKRPPRNAASSRLDMGAAQHQGIGA